MHWDPPLANQLSFNGASPCFVEKEVHGSPKVCVTNKKKMDVETIKKAANARFAEKDYSGAIELYSKAIGSV
jgi:hypothetical protein